MAVAREEWLAMLERKLPSGLHRWRTCAQAGMVLVERRVDNGRVGDVQGGTCQEE